MKPTDDIQRLFNKAGLSIRPDVDEQVFQDVLAARRKSQQNIPLPRSRWRITMKSPITKLAIAAAVVIACAIGLSFWRITGSGIALADVLAQIEKVKSVRWQWSYKITGGDPNTYKPYNESRATWLTSQEYGSKSTWEVLGPDGEWSQHREMYTLPRKKTAIHIYPTERMYFYQELEDAHVEQMKEDNIAGDPLGILKGILETKYESLGRSTMDGVEVAGFRVTDPNWFMKLGENQQVDYRIWVDVKTLLPVRFDVLASAEVDEMVDRLTHHVVMRGFQWDVPVDAAEFEPPPIPDGYAITDMFPELANEETTIRGLRQCVELLGKYPERIDLTYLWSEFQKSETPTALRVEKELKGLTGFDRDEKKMDALKPMRLLVKFYLGSAKNDSAYYGKTVTPNDADEVLMRWKVSDSEYRVIFGDLHAETVSPEKLAELEANLPQ
jgi:hypothetical protein